MTIILRGNCIDCDAFVEALDRHRRCPLCHVKRDDALEALAEIAAMYCTRLPHEVVEALHTIPHIAAVHPHKVGK